MTYEEYQRLRAEAHAKGTEICCIEATITGMPSGLIDRAAERLFSWAFPSAEAEAEAGG